MVRGGDGEMEGGGLVVGGGGEEGKREKTQKTYVCR